MTQEKEDPTESSETNNQVNDIIPEPDSETGRFGRRSYLKYMTTAATAVGVVGATSSSVAAAPKDYSDWGVSFEDTFDGGSLDSSKWDVGFGWGLTTTASAERISESQIDVRDGKLYLTADYNGGDILAGSINTRDIHAFGPGSYWEARIKNPKRTGFLPAFWAKANSEAFPPELDIMELFQDGSGRDDWTTANYNTHWSVSTEPNDRPITNEAVHYDTGTDLSASFHTYGCAWLSDHVEFYFDDQLVGTVDDPDALLAFEKAAPFYMMLNIHIDKVGRTDKSENWTEEMVVDWVRVWEPGADGTPTDGTTDGGSSDDSSTERSGDHYIWFRSSDGTEAGFGFEASGGNVQFDTTDISADYQISDDGTAASGTLFRSSSLPGLWYDGSLENFTYEGALEVFVDDQPVDPDRLVEETETTEDEASEHYLWVRSGDGSAATFAFEATGGNLRYDTSDIEADYWISDDATLGGGTVDRTSSLPGFWYQGDIADFSYSGSLDVFVDDQPVDPESLVDESSPGPEEPTDYPHSVTLSGSGSYSLTTSEALASTAENEDDDAISGSTASGTLSDDADEYLFSGELTGLTVDGDVAVTLDGTRLERLEVERSAGTGTVSYIVETSGGILGIGSSAQSSDETTDSKIFGTVRDGTDTFWLSGTTVDDVSTFGGDVVTTVDGTVIKTSD